jgi:hypothetical protein
VLPNGFQRIRYYGFLGNRYRQEKLASALPSISRTGDYWVATTGGLVRFDPASADRKFIVFLPGDALFLA